ncbi:hypothetical protein OSTOST_12716, partial [Ostertagia ostertagi]
MMNKGQGFENYDAVLSNRLASLDLYSCEEASMDNESTRGYRTLVYTPPIDDYYDGTDKETRKPPQEFNEKNPKKPKVTSEVKRTRPRHADIKWSMEWRKID